MRSSTRAARSAIHALRLPALVLGLLLAALASPADAAAQHGHDHGGHSRVEHPRPRRGVTAAGVRAAARVKERARDTYTIAARIPEVLDGIFCHCNCHEVRGRRSLLECFTDQMAADCGICQGQARQAAELHRKGKSLDEIRAAIDQRWGG